MTMLLALGKGRICRGTLAQWIEHGRLMVLGGAAGVELQAEPSRVVGGWIWPFVNEVPWDLYTRLRGGLMPIWGSPELAKAALNRAAFEWARAEAGRCLGCGETYQAFDDSGYCRECSNTTVAIDPP